MTFPALALFGLLLGPAALAQEGDVSGQAELTATLTNKEKLDFADDALQQMKAVEAHVNGLLLEAEKSGDEASVPCLRRIKRAVSALIGAAEDAAEAMREAIAANDTTAADAQYRLVSVALSKVQELALDADACGGVGTDPEGTQTIVEVLQQPSLEASEQELELDIDFEVGEAPPETSPF